MKTDALAKPLLRSTLPWVLAGVLLWVGAALADEPGRNGDPVKLLTTIPVLTPSPLRAFDISWVDPETQFYFLGDRSNASVDVVDARTNQFVGQIKGANPARGIPDFAGVVFKANPNAAVGGQVADNDRSGPNGVVVSGHWLFVTDAASRVRSIDLRTNEVVSLVSTGGEDDLRADELAYDPQDGILLVVNNADDPPFATLIRVDKDTGELTLIALDSSGNTKITFTDATNGAEQPVWDRHTRRFYLSIPEIGGGGGTGPVGAVKRINPFTGAVEATFIVNLCQPAGLTLGPHQDLLIGCSVVFDTAGKVWNAGDPNSIAKPEQVILDAKTGEIERRVGGVGGSDEVWFNPGDQRYYTASRANPTGPVLGVIDAERQTLVQIVPTFNGAGKTSAPPFPASTAHSVAVDPHNNHVLVPLGANNVFPDCSNGCIAVFGTPKGHDDEN